MLGEDLHDRQARHRGLPLHPLEGRRLVQPQADEQPEADQQRAGQERDPPAPGEELRLRQEAAQREGPDRRDDAEGVAELDDAAEEAAPLRRDALHHHQDRAAPLAADPDALDQAQRHEQDRGPQADLRVGRQAPDQERAEAHDDDGQGQHRLAADLVAEMPEDDAAEGARQEAHRVGAERRDGADQRVEAREEQLVEHERRGRSVDQEVVPLDRRADDARPDDLTPVGDRHRAGLESRGRLKGQRGIGHGTSSTVMDENPFLWRQGACQPGASRHGARHVARPGTRCGARCNSAAPALGGDDSLGAAPRSRGPVAGAEDGA